MAQNIISLLIELLQAAQRMDEDDAMIRAIVKDSRVPSTTQLGPGQKVRVQGAIQVGDGKGWTGSKPIEDWRPPGLSIMDAMMDAEDDRWRAARKKEFGG